ncbi:MAG: hypothetical protein K2N89_04235 [Lachnospiraceae bacterium]|nr:hypothetical protein [Lachnospiraceae bacterium]
MRQEETKFLELLGSLPKSKLLSTGRFKAFQEEMDIIGDFDLTISRMVNSFSFSKKEVLEAIMAEKKLSDSFLILSLHYIKQCSDKWCSDYWDRRDMASVKMCRDIVACSKFSEFYESKCRKESGIWELCSKNRGYHKDMLLGVKLINSIYMMHPTNRQTLSGLVLSFYANSHKMEKLCKAEHKAMGLPYHENVGFVMI